MSETAPFDVALSEGPESVGAYWTHADDGVRLRFAIWPRRDAVGTVVIFNGRTEYCEKYGRIAGDLNAAGFAVVTMDWRGQGLSDRLIGDARLGHVARFSDYQRDVEALLAAIDAHDLPMPRHLVAHSMGGAIGLRTLIEGRPFSGAVFSAPMWGIKVSPMLKPVAAMLPKVARTFGQPHRRTPGTTYENYIRITPFSENELTGDEDHYRMLAQHVNASPALALGGPTLRWFEEALAECAALLKAPRPEVGVKTFIGTNETIVDAYGVEEMHRNWPSADLTIIEEARHELMMEVPSIRDRFLEGALSHFRRL